MSLLLLHAFMTNTGQATFVRSDGLTVVNIKRHAAVRQTDTAVSVDTDISFFRTWRWGADLQNIASSYSRTPHVCVYVSVCECECVCVSVSLCV
jgi:hypothetical protein